MSVADVIGKVFKKVQRPRQPLKLTGSGQILILIAFAVGAAAMNTGNNLLYLSWALVLSAIIFSGLLSELTLFVVRVSLKSFRFARAGERCQIPITLHNRSKLFPSFGIMPALRFNIQTREEKINGEYVLRLRSAEKRDIYAEFYPQTRGVAQISSVTLLTQYPFGFFTKSWRYYFESKSFYILPQRLDVTQWMYRLILAMGEIPTPQRGRGDEFFSLKNYEQGDDPRMISWRHSAKTGRLYVKENEATQGGILWLVLQAKDLRPQEGTDVPSERAISFMASLSEALIANGHRVGICAPGIYLRPSNSQGHQNDILQQLAVLKDPMAKSHAPPSRQLAVRIYTVEKPTERQPVRMELQ
jgi:uncharacterized protein (DUF58 family)